MNADPHPSCILCDDQIPTPPTGTSYQHHAYLFGFADGVRAARAGVGPKLCDAHRGMLDAALAARGLARGMGKPGGIG
jgi:hypothetical protein